MVPLRQERLGIHLLLLNGGNTGQLGRKEGFVLFMRRRRKLCFVIMQVSIGINLTEKNVSSQFLPFVLMMFDFQSCWITHRGAFNE